MKCLIYIFLKIYLLLAKSQEFIQSFIIVNHIVSFLHACSMKFIEVEKSYFIEIVLFVCYETVTLCFKIKRITKKLVKPILNYNLHRTLRPTLKPKSKSRRIKI